MEQAHKCLIMDQTVTISVKVHSMDATLLKPSFASKHEADFHANLQFNQNAYKPIASNQSRCEIVISQVR